MKTKSTTPKGKLQEGLRLALHGDALEVVRSKAVVLKLLVAGEVEVVEGTLSAGERITLLPSNAANSDAVESYYILSGRLSYSPRGRVRKTLAAGDYIVTKGLREAAIFSALEEVNFLYVTSKPFFHEISSDLQELMRLAVEVELKDGYTAGHCLRLQRLSFSTGQEIGLTQHQLHLLDHGAYLHDVGKIKIPLKILQKASTLTAEEWKVIKQHPTFGKSLLEPTFVRESGKIVEQHHERLDGSGYPFGLAGEEILTESYVVAIADAYDAMTTDRSYRKALPADQAKAELSRYSGVHYPAELVKAFLSSLSRAEPNR